MDPQGKVALITGASAGIGREFARQLHAAGASVVLVARRADVLHELMAALNQTRPNSARIVVADLGSEAGIARVRQFIAQDRVDILINNVGRGSFGRFEQLSVADEVRMVRLNIEAGLRLTHEVLPQMKLRRSGAVVFLSSIAGVQPVPYMSTYAATKAFNLFQALGLRYEVAPFGVQVLAVCPGPVATDFFGVARVPGTLTGQRRDDVTVVVRDCIKALRTNRARVYPGPGGRLLGLAQRLVPQPLAIWFTERVLAGVLRAAEQQVRGTEERDG